jgi:hypothetical protein
MVTTQVERHTNMLDFSNQANHPRTKSRNTNIGSHETQLDDRRLSNESIESEVKRSLERQE